MEPPAKKKKQWSDYDGLIALLLLLFSPLIALAVAALANLFGIESPYPALTGWIVAYAFSIGFAISGVRQQEGCAQVAAVFTLLLIILSSIFFVLPLLTTS